MTYIRVLLRYQSLFAAVSLFLLPGCSLILKESEIANPLKGACYTVAEDFLIIGEANGVDLWFAFPESTLSEYGSLRPRKGQRYPVQMVDKIYAGSTVRVEGVYYTHSPGATAILVYIDVLDGRGIRELVTHNTFFYDLSGVVIEDLRVGNSFRNLREGRAEGRVVADPRFLMIKADCATSDQ